MSRDVHPSARTRAVALRYDPGLGNAPRVTAKGQGELAHTLLELARAHRVPIHEDPDLVQLLASCELGAEVPEDLYRAVAELLVWLRHTSAHAAA
jgi:flagellar biosynthesis protein